MLNIQISPLKYAYWNKKSFDFWCADCAICAYVQADMLFLQDEKAKVALLTLLSHHQQP